MVRGAWYAAGFLAAAIPCAVMWGFTVDDALIPLRYAHHLADGAGYRFDAHGPVTDGVTPLPWAPILAPLAGGDLLVALGRAKLLGAAAWAVAATALGGALGARAETGEGASRLHAALALVLVALAFPIAAWAVSGMETGLATALATGAAIALVRGRDPSSSCAAAALAGLSASLRPELAPWAMALAFGIGSTPRRIAKSVAIAAAPFAATALVRLAVFGRPAPLAMSAKPSDLAHGLPYAAAATVVVLTPLLGLGAFGRGASRAGRTIAVAAALHVIVVVAVGGDWMPYARLMVPIAPSLALVHVEALAPGRTFFASVFAMLRAGAALALGVALAVTGAPAGRHVLRDRTQLVEDARPLLETPRARVVAALDVGWVGAATEADIVDLAGLTDPAIAALPGGHTSKRVDVGMLLDRDVDTVVLFDPPRAVEARLSRAPLFSERFAFEAELRLGTTGRYRIYRRRL